MRQMGLTLLRKEDYVQALKTMGTKNFEERGEVLHRLVGYVRRTGDLTQDLVKAYSLWSGINGSAIKDIEELASATAMHLIRACTKKGSPGEAEDNRHRRQTMQVTRSEIASGLATMGCSHTTCSADFLFTELGGRPEDSQTQACEDSMTDAFEAWAKAVHRKEYRSDKAARILLHHISALQNRSINDLPSVE